MKFKYLSKLKPPKWLYRSILALIGIIFIVFNDVFGESEVYAVIGLCYFILVTFLIIRWLFKQIKTILQLKNEQKKVELLHLKSQVNPHFFFNTLNNLYGLVKKDPEAAQNLILKLSDMMRYSIYEGQKEWVSIKDEVSYIHHYLELHKMRYHKETDVQFEANITDPNYKVMPLLFILLVENAFKHGVERLRKNAFVHCEMKDDENAIQFEILNNFEEDSTDEKSTGIGLQNLKRRLELAYPKQHELHFSTTENVFKAHLTLKKK